MKRKTLAWISIIKQKMPSGSKIKAEIYGVGDSSKISQIFFQECNSMNASSIDLVSKSREWLLTFALAPLPDIVKPRDIARVPPSWYSFIHLTNAREHLLHYRHFSLQNFFPSWSLYSSDFTALTAPSLRNKMFLDISFLLFLLRKHIELFLTFYIK